MAIDDVSFYNILGEEVSRNILVQQMVDYYFLKLQVGETKVTDFNEGSEIRNLLESVAVDHYTLMDEVNEVGKIGFVDTAYGEWLDKHGSNPMIQLARNVGDYATGLVTFSIPEALTTETVIPEGTILVDEDTGLEFITDREAVISVGDTSDTVGATCMTVGVDGNVESGKITLITDDFYSTNSISVTNSEAFTGGVDYEEDDVYRERLLSYIQKDDFGSRGYYTELGNNVDGVHDVLLVSNADYTAKVLVNGKEKPTPSTVLLDVLAVYSDTDNIVINHNFTVDKPTYVTKNFTINAEMYATVDDDLLKSILTDYIYGGSDNEGFELTGLNIGEGLSRTEVYPLFETIDSLASIQILVDGTELDTVTINEKEVLKIGTITVNQTLVE